MLSARAGVGVGEAFTRMRTHARRTGDQLTTVAEAIVAGALDPGELQPVVEAG
jgi:AmiR/NasT family two-component response regulator